MRLIVVFLAMTLAYGTLNYSPQASTEMKVFSVDLGGITGAANTTALAYGRFVLVAPFAPSKGVDENGDLDLTQLDNRTLYVVDSKRANNPPVPIELTGRNSKSIYFPTRVLFDSNNSIAYVRGTRFEERFEEKDGEVTSEVAAVDVIAYIPMSLDGNGKPVSSTVVPIDIQGVSTKYTSEAPLDFALGAKGDVLVLTNGASVFSYNLDHGYLHRVDIVSPTEYSVDNSVSFLNVDEDTNVVSVCWNRRSVGEDNVVRVSSELSFYRLLKDGGFEFLTRTYPNQFPEGTALASGSNITIVSDPDKENSEVALFVTTDGSLCSVDLYGDDQGVVNPLCSFPELSQSSLTEPNRLLIQYDSSKRVVGIVQPGFTVQISRPSNGRRGRISRPSNLHIMSASPVLAMARLNKKGKVISTNAFTEEFKEGGGLSNFVSGQDSEWLISTYSGQLYSVDIASDLQDSKLQLVGPIGSRVERIDYYADRTSVVAINSFAPGEEGIWVDSPGSLVVGKLLDPTSQSAGGAVLQALLPTASALGKPVPSIRRPSNIKR